MQVRVKHSTCQAGDRDQVLRSKRLRNLRKKLREVKKLEAKASCTVSRNWWNEMQVQAKLARRVELESEIALLEAPGVGKSECRSPKSLVDSSRCTSDVASASTLAPADGVDSPSHSVTPSRGASNYPSGNASDNVSSTDQEEKHAAFHSVGNKHADNDGNEPRDMQTPKPAAWPRTITWQEQCSSPVMPPSFASVTVKVKEKSCVFRVPRHLELVKLLGYGTYGAVAQFKDTRNGQKIAIKKVSDAFHCILSGMRTLRELRVLQAASHSHVVKFESFYCSHGTDFDDIYMMEECMDTNLSTVIRNLRILGAQLTDAHHKVLMYGIVRGLLYLHSMDVAHRDLKPANILVNKNCAVKLCDFNLARGGMHSATSAPVLCATAERGELSAYVATRWYRAPEIMIHKGRYGKPIDIWALGCILGELVERKPIFQGSNSTDQLRQIIKAVGPRFLASKLRREELDQGIELKKMLPNASEQAIKLLIDLLHFEPSQRPVVKDVLRNAYFALCYSPTHEIGPCTAMDWSFDNATISKARLWDLLHEGENKAMLEPHQFIPWPHGSGNRWADIIDEYSDEDKH